MAEVASAFVSLMPSAKGFGKSTQRQIGPQMNSVAKTTGSRFGKVFATATVSPLRAIGAAAIGLFAVKKIKDFFGSAISEARESQKVSAITAQVIKTTGGAANISAGQVGKLATSISNLTGIDDEAVQGGANLLLTFKNLRNETGKGNDVFNQATKIITDMSVALGTDVKGSAIQVGKALNDPIKGIAALTRVGVTFTDQQKKQIETLVASGNTLKAQKIILRELNSEFGGTAAAAATAGEKFKTTFANFQEAVGTSLLPYLDKAQLAGIKLILLMQNDLPRAFTAFKNSIAPVVAVVRSFVEDHLEAFKVALSALGGSALTSLITLIGGSLVSAIAVLVGALASPIALIGAAAGAAIYAYVHFESFRTAVNDLAISARDNLVPALQTAAQYVLTNVVPALIQAGNVVRTDVLPVVRSFATFMLTEFYPVMIKAWAVVAQKLVPVFVALGQVYVTKILPVQRQLLAQLREYGPVIGPVVANITRMIAALAILGATIAGKTMPPAIKFATVLTGPVFSGLLAVMQASNRAEQAIGLFARAVVQGAARAVTAIQGLPGKAKAALGNLSSLLYSAGQDLMRGFINGVKSMASELAGAAKDAAQSAVNGVKGILKIGSPSKVFDQIGRWTMEGMANGVKGASVKVLKEMQDAVQKTLEKVDKLRDGVASRLDSLKSAFSSLKDSIASTFTGNLFDALAVEAVVPEMVKPEQFDKWSAQTQQNWLDQAALLQQKLTTPAKTASQVFTENLLGVKGNLKNLVGAFKKLVKWGLSPGFLSQLFSSGNGGLILELAGGSKATALQDSNLFGQVQSLSNQLGGQVARNQYGDQITRLDKKLANIEDHTRELKHLAKDIGRELNQAAAAARRDKSRGGAAA